MARVTYGSGVTELAGSIGGVTYQKNASGNIAKLRANPVVNPSSLQAGYQNTMAYLVSLWPTLSQANKDLWDALAAAHNHTTPWGETKALSGYQWFLSANLNGIKLGQSARLIPGSWYVPSPPNSFTIQTSSTYIRCAWSPAYTPTYDLLSYCTLPLRQSSLKLRRSLFFIKDEWQPGALTTYDLTSEIESLINVTWSTFYASANCSLIIRLVHAYRYSGWASPFTSAIVKI